jgi:hypothetical protein
MLDSIVKRVLISQLCVLMEHGPLLEPRMSLTAKSVKKDTTVRTLLLLPMTALKVIIAQLEPWTQSHVHTPTTTLS